jgi:YbbR domain-containing protein
MSATFPAIIEQNKRRFVRRSDVEAYKRALAGLPFEPDPKAPEMLIPVKQFAAELGVCVRTIGRRIAESKTSVAA